MRARGDGSDDTSNQGEPRRRRVWTTLALLGAGGFGLTLACIIPDRDIQVRTTDINLYPVRFVEGIPLDLDARCACNSTLCECPLPPFTALPTFLDPDDTAYQFCVCGENKTDAGRLPGVTLFVEDQDEVDGTPTDLLFAAALLDWNPTLDDRAFEYVAYRSYLDPRIALDPEYSSYENDVIKRPRPYVRNIQLSEGQGFDLCNGAGPPVGPGFHTLSIMVTDRQWFQREPDAATEMDTGNPEGMPVVLEGVPDIAAGATYDLQTYVFFCFEEGEDFCGCVDDTEP